MRITIILLSVLALAACSDTETNTAGTPVFEMTDTMLKRCPTELVEDQEVMHEMRLFGKIEPDNNKLVQVYSVLGGNVMSINVELGDYVTKGQVLAEIRSAEVAEFRRQKLDAENALELAEKNLQVARELYAGKLNAERDVKVAERELEAARNELARISEVYGIYRLRGGSVFQVIAPISGFIIYKDINQNELLRSDKSDVLFSIAEINEVWAMANVNESDISHIKTGYKAEVRTLSFPDEVFEGTIDKIFNTIDPETKAMKVMVRIPNAAFRLKPEMSATVTVRYRETKKLPVVPSTAVIFDKNKYWVMVFRNKNKIETREIQPYSQSETLTYVKSGLNPGEKIIAQNGLFIYDAIND